MLIIYQLSRKNITYFMNNFDIDPNFSVFKLAKRKSNMGITVSHLPVLQEIRYEIENASLIDHAENILFCGFQRLSQFAPHAEHYRKLAKECEHIYVFAVLDAEIDTIEGVSIVPLKASDQLAKEWFIVSYGYDFFSALASEEISSPNTTTQNREYRGTWMFDLKMVEILYDWLCREVGLNSEHIEQNQEVVRHEISMMEKTLLRIQEFIHKEELAHHDTTVHELQVLLDTTLYPALQTMRDIAN